MPNLTLLSDADLLSRMPALVLIEHGAVADVVEHLVELDRRQLYLEQACPSLYAYCFERLGYSEDAALKRIRVARLAAQLPRVLDELRSGAIQLTGLLLLAPRLTEDNAEALLTEARGKSRRKLEQILARWFPRPDVPPSVQPLWRDTGRGATGSSPGAVPSGPTTPLDSPRGDTTPCRCRSSNRCRPSVICVAIHGERRALRQARTRQGAPESLRAEWRPAAATRTCA